MKRALSILAATVFVVANVGAAPVPNHQKPQRKIPGKRSPARTHPRVAKSGKRVTKAHSSHKAKPYQVGYASWYGKQFHGRVTASGEDFDMFELTAAHRKLPLGTYVKVTNLQNGKWIIVRINDRGPYVAGRILDLSYSAARMLGFRKGVERVRLDVVHPASMASTQDYGGN